MELHRLNEDNSLVERCDFDITNLFKQETGGRRKHVSFSDASKAKLRDRVLSLLVELFVDLEGVCLPDLMCSLEKKILLEALTISKGNIRKTSRLLGVKYTTLHEKLKRYKISVLKQPVAG